ncbi:hypothetical protein HG15A2_16640 [Adhaeretor mobilis]|uniref:Uncharacterized protein n=1 Tax=Adhaeretor mobilis TaxID=1930276 RepID=A0A517MU28_9BACT|nr:hypothetical protein HG15A2_16640 [Adhaeretor mobilis]
MQGSCVGVRSTRGDKASGAGVDGLLPQAALDTCPSNLPEQAFLEVDEVSRLSNCTASKASYSLSLPALMRLVLALLTCVNPPKPRNRQHLTLQKPAEYRFLAN